MRQRSDRRLGRTHKRAELGQGLAQYAIALTLATVVAMSGVLVVSGSFDAVLTSISEVLAGSTSPVRPTADRDATTRVAWAGRLSDDTKTPQKLAKPDRKIDKQAKPDKKAKPDKHVKTARQTRPVRHHPTRRHHRPPRHARPGDHPGSNRC